MSGSATFIAGDWGTSHLRLSLCDARGQVLGRRFGPGVAQVGSDFPGALAAAAGDWLRARPLPIMLCGMVGSNIGWTTVPYLPCKVPLEHLAGGAAQVAQGVAIAPGLSCINLHGAPDVLRGEETQVLGALTLDPALAAGSHLLCLPGTHTKWVIVEDGAVREFLTAVSGELFALIREHSVLVRLPAPQAGAPAAAFERGAFDRAVAQVAAQPQASLLHLLFECRSRQVRGGLSAPGAAAYLSGLLVATDVGAALAEFGARLPALARTTLIGEPSLTALYAAVFAAHRVDCAVVDGAAASLAGLTSLRAQLARTTSRG